MNKDIPLSRLYRDYGIVKPGDTVIQAGCNLMDNPGSFAFTMAKIVGPGGTVVVTEPNPEDIFMARAMAKKVACRVIAVEKALWHEPGKTRLYTGRQTPHSDRMGQLQDIKVKKDLPPEQYAIDPIEVETDTLDNILNELGIHRVSHIELTINGAEWNALQGMEKTLTSPGLSLRVAAGRQESGIDGYFDGTEDHVLIGKFLEERGFRTKFQRIKLEGTKRRVYGFLMAADAGCDKDLGFMKETNWGYNRARESEPVRREKFHLIRILYHYRLASECESKKEYETALKMFDLLLKKSPIPDDIIGGIHFHRGRIHYMLKNYESAKECFSGTTALIPDHNGAKRFLSKIDSALNGETG